MAQTEAFDLLHEGLRRQLWKMGWTELHPLQVKSIHQILAHEGHAVLSAGTASGKTEAAFLPVLSAIADEAEGSVRAIYVGPLKALINDQFMRLEDLCGYLDMPVHRWHGDVGAAAKSQLISKPGGVLLITPESMESLFVNRSRSLTKLFHGLRFVVIDELHSFLDNERGRHLRSLLYRVARLTERPLRLIGLSATIGKPAFAKEYFDRDKPDDVAWIEGSSGEAEIKLRLHTYVDSPSPKVEHEEPDQGDADEIVDTPEAKNMAADLLVHCRGRANLIFANRRADVEYFGDLCARMATKEGLPDQFFVHHGSLSAAHREQVEEAMKQASHNGAPATTFCSTTLEMGIDIGSVVMVGQIGAPHSVASLKQRLGRSGRRQGTARTLRAYLQCRSVDDRSDLFDRLHLPLIQTIATIELLLRGWVEPAEPSSFDLSTLTQQIISMIAETGGAAAADIYRLLCVEGAFRDVDQPVFVSLLRQLGREDVVEQAAEGVLILGLLGEEIRKDKSFYAAFQSADAFAVIHDGRRVGTVDQAPEVNQHMILAGRRWKVTDVDERQLTIYIVPAMGRKDAIFAGGRGSLHDEIVAEMRRVLASSGEYAYLSPAAGELLADARRTAAAAAVCDMRFVQLDDSKTVFMTWVGDRTLATLQAIFQANGVETVSEGVGLVIRRNADTVAEIVEKIAKTKPDEDRVLGVLRDSAAAKYDPLLSDSLLLEKLKRRMLAIPQAMAVLIG